MVQHRRSHQGILLTFQYSGCIVGPVFWARFRFPGSKQGEGWRH